MKFLKPQSSEGAMRDKILDGATVLLVLGAILATAVTAWRSIVPDGTTQRAAVVTASQSQPDWSEYAGAGRVIGPEDGPVVIVQFADFQCPFCRTFKAYVDSLRQRYPNQVKLVYRHFPLRGTFAVAAVRASECGAQQGRFEGMYEALFDNQASIGVRPWTWFATKAQVPDSAAFARCVRSTDGIAALRADTIAGNRLGIRGTPTILVNGRRFDGLPPLDSIEAHLARASTTVEVGR